MKTAAGRSARRLKGRNAAQAQPSAIASGSTISFWFSSATACTAKTPHEMAASEAASPSMLSSRLNAFVIPTSQRSPIARASASLPTISTERPAAKTTPAAANCAASFASGRSV